MASNRGMVQNIVMRRGAAVGDVQVCAGTRIHAGRVGNKVTFGLGAVLVG